MKAIHIIAIGSTLLFGGILGASTTINSSAEAAVCARGMRGAACAGPRGVAAVHRAPVLRRPVAVPYRRAVRIR